MAVRIRLARSGSKKKPFYRIVAADVKSRRDGRFLEKLGTYNPLSHELSIEKEAVQKWLADGASPSDTVVRLLNKEGFGLAINYVAKEKQPKKAKEA